MKLMSQEGEKYTRSTALDDTENVSDRGNDVDELENVKSAGSR